MNRRAFLTASAAARGLGRAAVELLRGLDAMDYLE